MQQHYAKYDDPLQWNGSEVEGQAADGGGQQFGIVIAGIEHGDLSWQQLDGEPHQHAVDKGDLEPHLHQEFEVAVALGPCRLADQRLNAERQPLQDHDKDRFGVTGHGKARQILHIAIHHQLAVVQHQQQAEVELGDQAWQPGKEQVRHGREVWHQISPCELQSGPGGKEVAKADQANDTFCHQGGLGGADQSQPQPTHHDVVEDDVEHGAAAHQHHRQFRAAIVAQQIGHRQIAGQQQGTAANPGEVVARLLPGVGALLDPQSQQDIGVGVIEQRGCKHPESCQQPEGIDQRLTGQLVVFRPLLEGDGGSRPHADHGGQTDQHHDDRIDQIDPGEASGANVVADEDAIDEVVGPRDQHGKNGGEGVSPEAAGHRLLAQC